MLITLSGLRVKTPPKMQLKPKRYFPLCTMELDEIVNISNDQQKSNLMFSSMWKLRCISFA